MTRVHTDLSRVAISVAPSPATSGTSLGVTDANAAYLPDTYPYWAVLVPVNVAPTRANSEIVKVTGGSSSAGTTTLTIVRAQGIPVTTAKTVTTSFDIYDANSTEANIGLNSLVINETPSGTVNGSNAAFDTASTYVAGTIQVYRDGQLMKGGGADYTETDNNTITFVTAPVTGSVLLVTYQHTVSTTGNADTLDGYHANATPTASNIPVLNSNAEYELGENAGLVLDAALSADGKYSGIVRAGTAGAALAFGDLCYLDPTDSRWELADANAAAGADGDSRGILGICVLAAAGDASATKMLFWGVVNAATAFPVLTINAPAYVSETAGDIVVTQPVTSDVVIRVIGVAVTGDELFFNPSLDYITHI